MLRSHLGKAKRYLGNLVQPGALVVLYHRVAELEQDPQLLSVRPDNFYNQVRYFKEHFDVLSIHELYSFLRDKKKFPERAVVLTFDDGYADNLYNALPVLESLQVSALFFISTSKMGSSLEMWWDSLERIFLLSNPIPAKLLIQIGTKKCQFATGSKMERLQAYQDLHLQLKYSPVPVRDTAINDLLRWASIEPQGRRDYYMLTPDQVKTMASSPFAVIGAHTHNHPALAILPYETQLFEMSQSRSILEMLIGQKVEHFSYPYGGKGDFSQESIRAAKEAGFKTACANFYGQAHTWTNRYSIPRILIRDWAVEEFQNNVKKFLLH